jgi:uncharacterized protein (UPF0332 family)
MFDGEAFLVLAEKMLTQWPDDEAAQRAAISRAYYAVFLMARAYLDATGQPVVREGRAHGVVWNRLANLKGQTGKSISQDGKRLREWRQNADYEIPHPVTNLSAEALTAAITARQLLDKLETLP